MRISAVLVAVIAFGVFFSTDTHKVGGDVDIANVDISVLTHQQEVWISALEWCESNGIKTAVNKKDRDGTPSWGSFQFKPETLVYYASKYGVGDVPATMDYSIQRKVVEQMVVHRDEIRWDRQFPVCVQKLGYPPRMAL